MPLAFPGQPSPEALRRRDAELRRAVLSEQATAGSELDLAQRLVRERTLLPEHPWLLAHEWEVRPGESQHGKGDLVFGDELGNLAAVEVKAIPQDSGSNAQKKRTRRRGVVHAQALKYAEVLWRRTPWAESIAACTWTNETERPYVVGRYGPLTGASKVDRAVERACWVPHLHLEHAVPVVGEWFRHTAPDRLRLAVVRLPPHTARSAPPWAQARVDAEIASLAIALQRTERFMGFRFDPRHSLYTTSAVKVRPQHGAPPTGPVLDAALKAGRATWTRELRALTEQGAPPHVVVAVGVLAWEAAVAPFIEWGPLRSIPPGARLLARPPGPLGKRLMLVEMRGREAGCRVLVIRVPEARSPNRRWSAEEIVLHPGFRELTEGDS